MTKHLTLRDRMELAFISEINRQYHEHRISRNSYRDDDQYVISISGEIDAKALLDALLESTKTIKAPAKDTELRLKMTEECKVLRQMLGCTIAAVARRAGYSRKTLDRAFRGQRLASLACMTDCKQALDAMVKERI